MGKGKEAWPVLVRRGNLEGRLCGAGTAWPRMPAVLGATWLVKLAGGFWFGCAHVFQGVAIFVQFIFKMILLCGFKAFLLSTMWQGFFLFKSC